MLKERQILNHTFEELEERAYLEQNGLALALIEKFEEWVENQVVDVLEQFKEGRWVSEFFPVSEPPLTDNNHPWAEGMSDLLLIKRGDERLVTGYCIYEGNDKFRWETNCSNGWDISEDVVGYYFCP